MNQNSYVEQITQTLSNSSTPVLMTLIRPTSFWHGSKIILIKFSTAIARWGGTNSLQNCSTRWQTQWRTCIVKALNTGI